MEKNCAFDKNLLNLQAKTSINDEIHLSRGGEKNRKIFFLHIIIILLTKKERIYG